MFDYGTDTVLPPSGHAAAAEAAGDAAAQARTEILAEAASISNVIGAMDDSVDKAALLANLRVVVGSALNSLQNASPASVSGILAQLKNLSKEMQQDAQEEVLSKDHKISVNATTSKINNDQAQQIAKRLDAIAHRQAEEARAAREASERDNLVSARKGTVPRASDEEIAEARSRLQEARESGDTVQIRRRSRELADRQGGSDQERLNDTRAAATTSTALNMLGRTGNAAADAAGALSRGDLSAAANSAGVVIDNTAAMAEAARRNVSVDPALGLIARGHYNRYIADPQNAAKLRAMNITNFAQFEAHRQENMDISYSQAASYNSSTDGVLGLHNTLSYEEFGVLVNAMSRFRGVTNNEMSAISRRYQNSGVINATGGTLTMNDIMVAIRRSGSSTAQADTDRNGQLSAAEIEVAVQRALGVADRNDDGRVSANEAAFFNMSQAQKDAFFREINERLRECAVGGVAIIGNTNGDRTVSVTEAANALIARGVTNANRIDTAAEFQAIMRPAAARGRQ